MPQRTPKFARVRALTITLLAFAVSGGQSVLALDDRVGQPPLGESLKQVQELDRSGKNEECSDSDEGKKRKHKARGDAPCLSWTMPLMPPRAVIVCVHGLGLHSGSFEQFGKAMMKRGYAVYAIDVRGFGSWMAAKGHQNVNFDACLEDVKTTIEAVRRANPGKTIVLLGESMGGAIALQSTALHPELVDVLISAVPAGERFQQKKTDLKVALHMLTGPRRKFDAGTDVVNQATTDPNLREEWKNDPLGRMELSAKELLQFQMFMNKNHDHARDIKKTPVLIVQGAKDKLVKPEGTVELYEELATADKELAMVDWAEHLIFEEGQFNDEILAVVDNWITARLPGGKAVAYLNQAKQLLQAKQLGAAIQVLEQAVQADPQSGEAELILGLAYAKAQRNELAREHLRKAMRLDRSTMNPEHRRKANQALMSLPAGVIAPRMMAALRGGPGAGGGLPLPPRMRRLQMMQLQGGALPVGAGNPLPAGAGDPLSAGAGDPLPPGAISSLPMRAGRRGMVGRRMARGTGRGNSQQGAAPPRVLVFGAEWCEPCKDLEPVITQAKNRFGNQVEFVNINVDDPKNEQLVEQYNVSPIPTVVFLTSDGQIADYSIGNAGVAGMIKGMAKILAKR